MKMQPAVEKLVFRPTAVPKAAEGPGYSPGTAIYYIDISQCASLMNRRFYRQGLQWAVSKIKLTTAAVDRTIPGIEFPQSQDGKIRISKLPNTWIMSNAWEKGFRAYQHMIKNATEENGTQSIKGKFLDFKIYADRDHHKLGFDANILPVDALNQEAVSGQWQPTEIELPSTTGVPGASFAYEIIAVGDNSPNGASGLNSKSLILGYASSRALPSQQDPNVPDDASDGDENWFATLFNDGTDQDTDVIQMLEVTGDNPPYPFENDKAGNLDTMYPGGQNNLTGMQIHAREKMTGTTVGNTTYLEGGTFPCGLIKIEIDNFDGSLDMQPEITIDLVPGTHRGYLAESMTEM